MPGWTCPLCKQVFVATHSQSVSDVDTFNVHHISSPFIYPLRMQAHIKNNLSKRADDPTRCDNCTTAGVEPLIFADTVSSVSDDAMDEEGIALIQEATVCDVTAECLLMRRPAYPLARECYLETKLENSSVILCTAELLANSKNMIPLQDTWDGYIKFVASVCSPAFWNFFLEMHEQSRAAIDAALLAAKKTFIKEENTMEWRGFVANKRALLARMGKQPPFWRLVTHCVKIDLSQFDIDKEICFRFIDPLWGWIMAARRLPPEELHWIPVLQRSKHSGDRLYGAGVQYGKAFEMACSSCPAGTYPMCVNLHWDGAHAHGLQATPIAIGVANTNMQCAEAHYCLSYMPVVPGMGKSFYSTSKATLVKHFIRDECISAILKVLELAAGRGVTCRLQDKHGVEKTKTLYPRLLAMSLDQPEAQGYFGLLNRTVCSKCVRRKGYSAHRRGKKQKSVVVTRLHNIILDTSLSHALRKAAREKLLRHGYNPERKCSLPDTCRQLLVRVPGMNEVFPCADYRDRLHGGLIFLHRIVVTLLSEMHLKKSVKLALDQRMSTVSHSAGLRMSDHSAGRVQHSVFSDTNMTAVDRVATLFYLPHVLGHEAHILKEQIRGDVLTAVAYSQLFLVALRGRRSYSERELTTLFDDGYVHFFRACERVNAFNEKNRLKKERKRHEKYPDKYAAPKSFKRKRRYVNRFACTRHGSFISPGTVVFTTPGTVVSYHPAR